MKKPFTKQFCLSIVQEDFWAVHRSQDDSLLGVAGGIKHRLPNRRKRTRRSWTTLTSFLVGGGSGLRWLFFGIHSFLVLVVRVPELVVRQKTEDPSQQQWQAFPNQLSVAT